MIDFYHFYHYITHLNVQQDFYYHYQLVHLLRFVME